MEKFHFDSTAQYRDFIEEFCENSDCRMDILYCVTSFLILHINSNFVKKISSKLMTQEYRPRVETKNIYKFATISVRSLTTKTRDFSTTLDSKGVHKLHYLDSNKNGFN